MKLTSLIVAATAVSAKSDDPETRLNALRSKVLEVVSAAGWGEDSKLYGRVNKKTSIVIAKSKQQRHKLMDNHDCQFPAHWDWQEYQVRRVNV